MNEARQIHTSSDVLEEMCAMMVTAVTTIVGQGTCGSPVVRQTCTASVNIANECLIKARYAWQIHPVQGVQGAHAVATSTQSIRHLQLWSANLKAPVTG